DIVLVALNTGLRKGEIFSLRKQDIDFDRTMLHISDSKNNESRDVPINDTLHVTLKSLVDAAGDPQGYIFVNPQTKKPYDDVKKSFKTALKKAGIEDFTFHDLRHTFASHLVMTGTDLMTVRELLGHKDITMTMRYTHLSPDHKRLAVQTLESAYKAEKKIIELPVAEK
ncbi:MAG: tyrosine-type recombinase/integrase, partial [Deltaproteobacteria bacterium]|nr:tyrosine-type recombinase/integrase [Deltaproteobacteria bacterium]